MRYTKQQLEKEFYKIYEESFTDVKRPKLFFRKQNYTGYSSPWTGNIFLDFKRLSKRPTLEMIRGVMAHELAHQVDYSQRPFYKQIFFSLFWKHSPKMTRIIEQAADQITIKRGYKKELLANREFVHKMYKHDKKMMHVIRSYYMTPEEIKNS